ncbi:MAG: hypothetical protein GY896_10760 [Gammaproteobacteria bacterium]|nr:hypothetical protein [Gammaproteobacteria bacterium]MCP4984392.1 hypothetical protein [Gammaproteobacteria bacterium]
MLVAEEKGSIYRVHYKSYVISLILLSLPPLLLIEHGPSLIDGRIEIGELIGFIIGIVFPLLGAYYFLEFASFTFSRDDDLLTWRWRNLIRNKSGQVAFARIVMVRRDAIESGDSGGLQYSHRLVVILDDGTMIPLTRGYSGLYSKKLDQIVDQIRDLIGHSR